MRKLFVALVALTLVSCSSGGPESPNTPNIVAVGGGYTVTYIHDTVHHVGIWISEETGHAIAILPDKDYVP